MPIRRTVLMTRRAISPRLATSTDSSTPGSLQAPRAWPSRDLAERLDHAGVVLGGSFEAQSLQRRRGPVPVGGAAHKIIEGVRCADDPAADRRLPGMPAGGAALPPDQVCDLVQHPRLPDPAGAQLAPGRVVLTI